MAHASRRENSADTEQINRVPLISERWHCAQSGVLKNSFSLARSDARIRSGAKPRAGARASRARSDTVVFRQKLLAALLNMCNAAENFLRNDVGSCK
jgi:hypothetical protein